jgi:hypothetical protein
VAADLNVEIQRNPHAVPDGNKRENHGGYTETETGASHVVIILKSGADFTKNPAQTDKLNLMAMTGRCATAMIMNTSSECCQLTQP